MRFVIIVLLLATAVFAARSKAPTRVPTPMPTPTTEAPTFDYYYPPEYEQGVTDDKICVFAGGRKMCTALYEEELP